MADMTDMTDEMMTDIADRMGGTVTPSGVLIPWADALLLLEAWSEDAAVIEGLQRRGILDSAGRAITPTKH